MASTLWQVCFNGACWMKPLVTTTLFRPAARADSAASVTYSLKMVGSLYVKATAAHSLSLANVARSFGGRYFAGKSSGLACEISQFWQNLQFTLQPAVATENATFPGRKWKKGFFSMGSMWAATTREWTSV